MRIELEWDERQLIAEWARDAVKEIGRTVFYGTNAENHDAKLTANEILKKMTDE